MADTSQLIALQEIMQQMLALAEQGQWQELIATDKKRSDLINQIKLDGLHYDNCGDLIDHLLTLDQEVMRLCLNRKNEMTQDLGNINKALKGLNEYLKHS